MVGKMNTPKVHMTARVATYPISGLRWATAATSHTMAIVPVSVLSEPPRLCFVHRANVWAIGRGQSQAADECEGGATTALERVERDDDQGCGGEITAELDDRGRQPADQRNHIDGAQPQDRREQQAGDDDPDQVDEVPEPRSRRRRDSRVQTDSVERLPRDSARLGQLPGDFVVAYRLADPAALVQRLDGVDADVDDFELLSLLGPEVGADEDGERQRRGDR